MRLAAAGMVRYPLTPAFANLEGQAEGGLEKSVSEVHPDDCYWYSDWRRFGRCFRYYADSDSGFLDWRLLPWDVSNVHGAQVNRCIQRFFFCLATDIYGKYMRKIRTYLLANDLGHRSHENGFSLVS